MLSRKLVSRAAAGCLGLTLAFGAVSTGVAPAALADTATFSNMVLNIGSQSNDRNFVWYSTSDAPQQVKLHVVGEEETTTRLLDPTKQGGSLEMTGLFWFHAEVTDLEPGATYSWQAGSDDLGWSQAYEFTVNTDGVFNAVVVGDTQIGSGGGKPSDEAAWQSLIRAAMIDVADSDMIISVGDQVNTHDSAVEYGSYLLPDELRTNALATNIGNHDDGSAGDAQHAYAEHFNMPNRTANPGWNNEMGNYWYISEGVLFVSLNSNATGTAAVEMHQQWLREVVAAHGADVDWKVATWHHALYSTASHATDRDIEDRRTWMPQIMAELDFDIVFAGHDHVYNRSHLMNSGYAVGDLSAPAELEKLESESLWFTMQSSTGSKYYAIQDHIAFPYDAVASQTQTPMYAHLQITDESIRVIAKHEDGTVIDDVTLRNAPAGTAPRPIPAEPAPVSFRGTSPVDQPVETVYDEATGEYHATARILTGNDDVEEFVDTGIMYFDSSDLEITEERPTRDSKDAQNLGLRFDRVQIPAGATITSAYLQFTVDEPAKSRDPFDVRIHIEDTGSARGYEDELWNVSQRDYLAETVAWKDIPAWENAGDAGAAQATPDISSLVQAVVDRDDWARNGAIGIMLTGSGVRTAEAFEGAKSKKEQVPTLHVTYTLDGVEEVTGLLLDDRDDVEQYVAGGKAGRMDHGSSDLEIVDEKPGREGDDKQIIGLRYDGLQIPQGAEIISARVQFATDEADKNVDPFSIVITAEDVDSSAPFTDADWDLSDRAKTEASAVWSDIPAWLIEHEQGPNQRTAELRDVVQAVVDRDGWTAGNALTLFLEGEGQRSAEAREGEPELAPELWIVYRVADDGPAAPTDPTKPGDDEQPADAVSGATPLATDAQGQRLAATGAEGVELLGLIAAGMLAVGAGKLVTARAGRDA